MTITILATLALSVLLQVTGPGPVEGHRSAHALYLPAVAANHERATSAGIRVLNCAPGEGGTAVWDVSGPGVFGAAWQFRRVDTDRVVYAHRQYIATSAGTLQEYKAPISNRLYLRSIFWAFGPSAAVLTRAYCGAPSE